MAKKPSSSKEPAGVSGSGEGGVPPKAAKPVVPAPASSEGASPAGGLQGPAGGAAVPEPKKEMSEFEKARAKRVAGNKGAKRVKDAAEAEELRRNTVVELHPVIRRRLAMDIAAGRITPTEAELEMAGLTKADIYKK